MKGTSDTPKRGRGIVGALLERRHWVTAGILLLGLALFLPGAASLWRTEPVSETTTTERSDALGLGSEPLALSPNSGTEVYAALEQEVFEPTPTDGGWAPDADSARDVPEDGDRGTLNCIIEPSEVVDIRSSVEGRIETIHVERSDTITKGQVLVELDNSVERAAAEVFEALVRKTPWLVAAPCEGSASDD